MWLTHAAAVIYNGMIKRKKEIEYSIWILNILFFACVNHIDIKRKIEYFHNSGIKILLKLFFLKIIGAYLTIWQLNNFISHF